MEKKVYSSTGVKAKLNESAYEIYQLYQQGFKTKEIECLYQVEYDVSLPVARRDVRNVLKMLKKYGFIKNFSLAFAEKGFIVVRKMGKLYSMLPNLRSFGNYLESFNMEIVKELLSKVLPGLKTIQPKENKNMAAIYYWCLKNIFLYAFLRWVFFTLIIEILICIVLQFPDRTINFFHLSRYTLIGLMILFVSTALHEIGHINQACKLKGKEFFKGLRFSFIGRCETILNKEISISIKEARTILLAGSLFSLSIGILILPFLILLISPVYQQLFILAFLLPNILALLPITPNSDGRKIYKSFIRRKNE